MVYFKYLLLNKKTHDIEKDLFKNYYTFNTLNRVQSSNLIIELFISKIGITNPYHPLVFFQ